MSLFSQDGKAVIWRQNNLTIRVEPWGPDAIRVRLRPDSEILTQPWDLQPARACETEVTVSDQEAVLRNGKVIARMNAKGGVRCFRTDTGEMLMEERRWNRILRKRKDGLFGAELEFASMEGERLYGLGQHPHGYLDQKGCFIELCQQNTQVTIPFLLSSRRYGFLWNNPAIGRVILGRNGTRWIVDATRQIDYVVIVGSGFDDIMGRYADLTGHAPVLPEWASGFWQCKLRYETQEELMAVAREHKRRGLPLSVIVSDYFHWTKMGDWKFDPVCWPDPAAMVRELEAMGVKLMVSVWPHVNSGSENAGVMREKGLLLKNERGEPLAVRFEDTGSTEPVDVYMYDPSNPEARKFVWGKVCANYLRAHGIKVWWLDACEPENFKGDPADLHYRIGPGAEVGCLYPLLHEQAFYDGMREAGEDEVVTLCRSAWAGSQRYGAALWSGDILSTFKSLQEQVRAGLNVACSGIPWWTTDIGGFAGGKPEDPAFRELLVRWFQYGAFCPLFRLHGVREPSTVKSGGPNEVWSFGEEVYGILTQYMFLRERLRPYIMEQMRTASRTGLPPMRPVFFDFPDDPACFGVEDEFMFGPALLVAPVLQPGATSRAVYLPAGAEWRDAWTGALLQGGQTVTADAPIEKIPLFVRVPYELPIRG